MITIVADVTTNSAQTCLRLVNRPREFHLHLLQMCNKVGNYSPIPYAKLCILTTDSKNKVTKETVNMSINC